MPISRPVYTSTRSAPPPSRLLLLFQLLLGDALSVTGQDLIVDLVDGPETKRDYHSREGLLSFYSCLVLPTDDNEDVKSPALAGDELFPANPESLDGVLGVSVLQHKTLLDLLIDGLQLLEMWLDLADILLVLFQPRQHLLEAALKVPYAKHL